MNFSKWLETTADEFLQHHQTGNIRAGAYDKYEEEGGLAWLGPPSKRPIVVNTKRYGEHTVTFRQSGEKIKYTATDEEGHVKYGDDGLALYMTDDEIAAKGKPVHDQTIVAYIGDTPVGFVSNEWGTIGVWVEGPYQRLGIGSDLMIMYMENNPQYLRGERKIGQMTQPGQRMARTVYKKLAAKYRDEDLIPIGEK
jgi:GNAT superfamily N-acetyltransferase